MHSDIFLGFIPILENYPFFRGIDLVHDKVGLPDFAKLFILSELKLDFLGQLCQSCIHIFSDVFVH